MNYRLGLATLVATSQLTTISTCLACRPVAGGAEEGRKTLDPITVLPEAREAPPFILVALLSQGRVLRIDRATGAMTIDEDGHTRSLGRLSEQNITVNYLYYSERREKVLLVYSCEDGETGWGIAQQINLGSGRTDWKHEIPAELGPPSLSSEALFVTGYGYVAQIELVAGTVVWALQHLNKGEIYERFGEMHLEGAILVAPDHRAKRAVEIDVNKGVVVKEGLR